MASTANRRRGPRAASAAAFLALVLALVQAAAVAAAAAPSAEAVLAGELAATLGPAVPPGARVSLVLTSPFRGPVDAVRDLSYDPRTGILRALVDSGGRLHDVAARAEIAVDVPVPVRRIAPGEIIGEADLTTVAMPLDRVAEGILTTRDALVGMASRRQLAAGRLVQATAVGAPLVVRRNKPVRLVYEDGALVLAARGRALQDGGVGEVVRVMNLASSVVVTGTVTGPETVSVAGPPAAAPPH